MTIGSLCSASDTSATCGVLNSTTYVVNSAGLNISSYTVTLTNIFVPYLEGASGSFNVTYTYGGSIISQLSTGIAISAYCTIPCAQCTSIKTNCLSCIPKPNNQLNYLYLNTCLTSCPDTYYINSANVCTSCISPCSNCSTATICINCISNFWLAPNQSCVAVCPSLYYNDSSGVCIICVSPCSICTTATICVSCVSNFFFNSITKTCVVGTSCPLGTYTNTTTNTCA